MSNILQLRKMYENAKILTEEDFKEALEYVLSDCKKTLMMLGVLL